MLWRIGIFVVAVGLSLFAQAAPVTSNDAARAVRAWVTRSGTFGTRLSRTVAKTETLTMPNGRVFYAVSTQDGGTVFTSDDTEAEPIVAFSSDAITVSELDPDSPLYVLLGRDAESRCVSDTNAVRRMMMMTATASAEPTKWSRLLEEADRLDSTTNGRVRLTATASSSVGDVRVRPLVKARWDQGTVSGKLCYNYYTPNKYICGCVATAMSQVMRHHCWPKTVKTVSRDCWVKDDSGSISSVTKQTLSGDYDWSLMDVIPNSSSGEKVYEAIGKLCYDAGVSARMCWGPKGSGAFSALVGAALRDVFGYGSGYSADGPETSLGLERWQRQVLTNLDAGYPVIFGIAGKSVSTGDAVGHEIVGDGYGYNDGTLYVHLNMGWSGQSDLWYTVPNLGEVSGYAFTSIDDIVYNIIPDGSDAKAVVSGRVTNEDGSAAASATVTLSSVSTGKTVATVKANAYGVYGAVLPTGAAYVARAVSGRASGEAKMSSALQAVATRSLSFNGYVGKEIVNFSTTKFCSSSQTPGNAYGLDVRVVRQATAFYVDAATTEDYAARDGTAAHPYKDLNEVDALDGDTVFLAKGTYESTLSLDDPSARVKVVARDFPSATFVRSGLQTTSGSANVEVRGVTFAGQVRGGRLVNCRVCGVSDRGWDADTQMTVALPAVVGATLVNCLVVGNAGRGAEASTLVNCTVVGNALGGIDAASSAVNSIVWSNAVENVASGAKLTRCETERDPRFVDAGADDWRLRRGSPCVDAGDSASVPSDVTTDLAGAERIQAESVDLGAFEGAVRIVPVPQHSVASTSHYEAPVSEATPRVLFFGTHCLSHGLSVNAVNEALKALQANADVDWYLFGNTSDYNGSYYKKGTLTAGGTAGPSLTSADFASSSAHYSLRAFLNQFAAILANPATSNAYDYVVIETDGSRLAAEYGGTKRDGAASAALEEQVARLLLPFYARNRVIWLLDDGFDYYHGETSSAYYFSYVSQYSNLGLSMEIFQYGSRCDNKAGRPYRVNSGLMKNSGDKNQYLQVLTDAQWKGLLSVFDPQLYLDILEGRTGGKLYAGDDGIKTGVKHFGSTSRTSVSTSTLYAGHPYANQTWYDNTGTSVPFLKAAVQSAVKPESGELVYDERIPIEEGLSLVSVKVSCATNALAADADGWMTLVEWLADEPEACDFSGEKYWTARIGGLGATDRSRTDVDPIGGRIRAALTNVTTDVWMKVEVGVDSDGTYDFDPLISVGGREYPRDPSRWPVADPDPQKNESGVDPVCTFRGSPTSVVVRATSRWPRAAIDVAYSRDGETWTADAPTFSTEIGTNVVWFAVTQGEGGYGITNKAYVIVCRRPVSSRGSDSFTVTPYVQHPTANGMSVLFFTKTLQQATVRCWPEDGSETGWTQTTVGDEATDLVPTGHPTDVPVWGTQYRNRVRFEGLKAGTTYRYEVMLDDDVVYTNEFRTAPDRDTPVRFVAYSDSETTPNDDPDSGGWDVLVNGKNTAATYPVGRVTGFAANIRHMMAWQPDLIVIAGDLVARGGVQMFWDEFWRHNAGANVKGHNDPAGSTPILAAIGNHDLYDNKGVDAYSFSSNEQGERALKHYLSYFEYCPNGVDYASAPENEKDTRDKSQLFHREDYGPVTLIFLDTTNGQDDDKTKDTNTSLSRNTSSTGARAPDFNEGTLQYQWLERNLSEAREKSRFIFVVSHHCPYSVGKHNYANGVNNGFETEACSSLPVRTLTPLLHKYGVTAWLCGHDEILEHSQHVGDEILADGTKRRHVLDVYDLGSAGDGLKGKKQIANPQEVFRAYTNAADGVHYGHLRVEAKPNAKGVWQCTLTPVYSYVKDASGDSELRAYADSLVVREDGTHAYEERKGVTLVEGDGSVVVDEKGNVTVSEDVRKLKGVSSEKVKVVYSDGDSGKSYEITGAFKVSGKPETGVTIELDPKGAVSVDGGDPISVTPTLTEAEDAVKPLVVGETTHVGVKTIPGLTYSLKRSESVAGVSEGAVVATEQARGPQTSLTDPMKGGKPEKAFYTIDVGVAQ